MTDFARDTQIQFGLQIVLLFYVAIVPIFLQTYLNLRIYLTLRMFRKIRKTGKPEDPNLRGTWWEFWIVFVFKIILWKALTETLYKVLKGRDKIWKVRLDYPNMQNNS